MAEGGIVSLATGTRTPDDIRAELASWQSRQYRQNTRSLGRATVGDVNERRRQRKVEGLRQELTEWREPAAVQGTLFAVGGVAESEV